MTYYSFDLSKVLFDFCLIKKEHKGEICMLELLRLLTLNFKFPQVYSVLISFHDRQGVQQ